MLIYILHNELNGKYYVGKTEKTLQKRTFSHFRSAKSGGTCRLLYRAIRKYGPENFTAETLCPNIETKEEMNNLEKLWIILLDATNKEIGYNLTFGGQGGVQTEDVRRKIAESGRGKTGGWNRGLKTGPPSDGVKRKISTSLRGRTLTQEHKKAISSGGKGKHEGARNANAKLTCEQVIEIRLMRKSGLTLREIANKFGVKQMQISRIANGQRWVHV